MEKFGVGGLSLREEWDQRHGERSSSTGVTDRMIKPSDRSFNPASVGDGSMALFKNGVVPAASGGVGEGWEEVILDLCH